MLKLKLQYFGQLNGKSDSLEKTLMLGKIEGGRRMGRQRMRRLDGITDWMDIHEFDPWIRKTPWGRRWQPTLVVLPGKSHGQGSLAGYSS